MSRLVWVDSLPTSAGPALIDVPKGMKEALQDESDGEQQRDALNTELPPRPSGFRQFVRLEEGGREGRGESGQDRYPACNNASERESADYGRALIPTDRTFSSVHYSLRDIRPRPQQTQTLAHTQSKPTVRQPTGFIVFSLDFPTLQAPKCPPSEPHPELNQRTQLPIWCLAGPNVVISWSRWTIG